MWGLRTCTVWRGRECLKSRTCPCCTRTGPWRGTEAGSGSEENSKGHSGLMQLCSPSTRLASCPGFLPEQGVRVCAGPASFRGPLLPGPPSAECKQLPSHSEGCGGARVPTVQGARPAEQQRPQAQALGRTDVSLRQNFGRVPGHLSQPGLCTAPSQHCKVSPQAPAGPPAPMHGGPHTERGPTAPLPALTAPLSQ